MSGIFSTRFSSLHWRVLICKIIRRWIIRKEQVHSFFKGQRWRSHWTIISAKFTLEDALQKIKCVSLFVEDLPSFLNRLYSLRKWGKSWRGSGGNLCNGWYDEHIQTNNAEIFLTSECGQTFLLVSIQRLIQTLKSKKDTPSRSGEFFGRQWVS